MSTIYTADDESILTDDLNTINPPYIAHTIDMIAGDISYERDVFILTYLRRSTSFHEPSYLTILYFADPSSDITIPLIHTTPISFATSEAGFTQGHDRLHLTNSIYIGFYEDVHLTKSAHNISGKWDLVSTPTDHIRISSINELSDLSSHISFAISSIRDHPDNDALITDIQMTLHRMSILSSSLGGDNS